MKYDKKIKIQYEIQEIIIRNIRETLDIDSEIKINEFTVLTTDLGCDSMDVIEILIGCEKDFKLELSAETFDVVSTTFQYEPIYKAVEHFCNLKKVPFTNPVVLGIQPKAANVKDAVIKMQKNVRAVTTNNVKQKKR